MGDRVRTYVDPLRTPLQPPTTSLTIVQIIERFAMRPRITMSDEIPVQDVLAAIGFDQSAEVLAVRGGADALLWRVTTADGVYALRLLRPDQRGQAMQEI